MNNAFGFAQPGQQQQYPFYTQQNPMQYQGAMPAGLFGVGASPNGVVPQQGLNMAPFGAAGLGLLQQAQNHSRPVTIGSALGAMAPGLMQGLAQNPQIMQGLMGAFGGGAAAGV